MRTISLLFFCAFFSFSFNTHGQKSYIQGFVYSVQGEPLPYASVYSKGSDVGTSSNEDGSFGFSLQPGSDQVVFQYLGFRQKILDVILKPYDTIELNVALKPLSMKLEKVVVSGDRNPADEIMREVIARRAEFEEKSNRYQAGVYIKGVYRIKDAPESFFGINTGGIDSILKGLPSDIIYLSETKSTYARWGRESKEEVLASKTSGMENFPSINRASLLDINFYQSSPELLRKKVKSPLASNAFSHYHFSFLGQYETEDNELIHKIGVRPKRAGDPLFSGYLEIVDGKWFLNAVNLTTDGRRLNIEFIDSLRIRQNFIPRDRAPIPQVVQTDFRIVGSAFGFVVKGGFTGVRKDFIFDRDSFSLEFDRTVLSYTDKAMERDSSFWLSERPISLSTEEKEDYHFKDSLSAILSDPTYLDSMDRKRNQFEFMNLLTGYSYRRRTKGLNWTLNSPLNSITFNPVQGWNLSVSSNFRKDWKENRRNKSSFEIYGQLQYGTSDERWRSWGEVAFKTGLKNPILFKLNGGYKLSQVPRETPISLNANQFSNLFFKNNYIRFYDQRWLGFEFQKSFGGFDYRQNASYEQRNLVQNTSNYSFYREDRTYDPNIPKNADLETNPDLWVDHNVFLVSGRLNYRPGLKFVELPQNRIEIPGGWPEFGLSYKWGVDRWSSRADFLRLELDVKYNVQMGIAGYSNWVFKGGSFVHSNDLTFFDYRSFHGNTFYVSKGDYRERYLNLPFYQFSTQNDYFEAHWLHNFQGFLLNKIPGVRNLGLALEAKAGYLYHKDIGHYNELSLGIDRIGWGIFRLFRLDLGLSFRNGEYTGWRLILGSPISMDDFQQKGTRL
ncbi:MAG: hypothetical protein GVX96_00495 [Bacteroidetes bacterium]|jgi:hypothetical protein|nr:hypothetical protein [Bacteroidota bacterium]